MKLIPGFAWGLAAVGGLLVTGCAKPPQVSQGNFKLIDGLRTAASAKDTSWLEACEKLLEEGKKKGTVSDIEDQEFSAIIALAREGKWEQAEAAAARLGEGQKPTPDDVARVESARVRKPGK
jgi:hypothetical protein